MLRFPVFILLITLSAQAFALTIKSGESINFSEQNNVQISAETADKLEYLPMSSLETEYAMMASPNKSRTLVPLPRESRNVGQGVFSYGPRTSIADFNGDGIDDVVTVGASAKKNQPKYKPGGKCTDKNWQGRVSDISQNRPGCNPDGIKIKPRISFGKADGGFVPASDDMFIHPAPKGKKVAGFTMAMRPHVADLTVTVYLILWCPIQELDLVATISRFI